MTNSGVKISAARNIFIVHPNASDKYISMLKMVTGYAGSNTSTVLKIAFNPQLTKNVLGKSNNIVLRIADVD
ncbi:uncharacterized protein N7479_000818 [Penicillium vulpinum]|uniref:uncharacterized protein n=1 Tax=Penicillium vulpinum TaxID=29845 RepID=UPI002548644E|nr:uncharacterized protein N7479_000818 [Penicillium vulpinum]KAJ5970900.1 hypothetical protein N7479_000818 [Penicillium vulpinum]